VSEGAGSAGSVTPPADFDSWLATQTDETKTLVATLHEAKVKGLKSALSSERDAHKTLEKQLDAAIAKATGAEKAALEAMQVDVQAANMRAEFFADCQAAGIIDPRTAWAAVKEYDLHDRKGAPDIDALKDKCPYLFQSASPQAPRVSAGAGAGDRAVVKGDFNRNLRQTLGVG
jgi:hypothetical protein